MLMSVLQSLVIVEEVAYAASFLSTTKNERKNEEK